MDANIAWTIRAAAPGDEATICALLADLAQFEKAPSFQLTAAAVARDLIGAERVAHCALLLAGGVAAGVVVWLRIYRSFKAQRGIYVEDLYVKPDFRGRGLGTALLAHLAKAALAEGSFLEWRVLDWNGPAIAFYKRLGAAPVREWITYRLEGENLEKLGA